MENRLSKEKPDKKRKSARKYIKEHLSKYPFWILSITGVVMILAPFALIRLMKFMDGTLNLVNFSRLDDGINTWFAFWGSYIGAVATVLLGIGAMFLSVKYEQINEDNNNIQQMLSFHNLRISHVILYDLNDSYPLEELERIGIETEKAGETGRFFLKIQFCDPFAPYFTIGSVSLKWGSGDTQPEKLEDLKITSHAVINNQKLDMYFLIDPSSEQAKDINFFYHINYYETKMMCLRERRRWLEIKFDCKNNAFFESEISSDMNFELKIGLENRDHYQESFVELTVCDRKLKLEKRSQKPKQAEVPHDQAI